MDIPAGATVAIEIVKVPRTAAARKTLDRVCRSDPAIRRRIRAFKRKRPSLQSWRRGGRFWRHRMRSKSPVVLEPGRVYTVKTTVPLLRDLQSIQRWIRLSAEPAS